MAFDLVVDSLRDSGYGKVLRSWDFRKGVPIKSVDCEAEYVNNSLREWSESLCGHEMQEHTISRESQTAASC